MKPITCIVVIYAALTTVVCATQNDIYRDHVFAHVNAPTTTLAGMEHVMQVLTNTRGVDIMSAGHDQLGIVMNRSLIEPLTNKLSNQATITIEIDNVATYLNKFDEIQQQAEHSRQLLLQQRDRAGEFVAVQDDWSWFEQYHNFSSIVNRLNEYQKQFPNQLKRVTFGETIENRQMEGILFNGIGDFNASKPSIVVIATEHAREWIAPATTMFILQSMLSNYTSDTVAKRIADYFVWHFIPVINVDGYNYSWEHDRMWRKNRRPPPPSGRCYGIDLNRNFGFAWGATGGSTDSCSEFYQGTSAFSEPESRSLSQYINSTTNMVAYFDFHSYGQQILFPWAYSSDRAPSSEDLFSLADIMQAAMRDSKYYTVGSWNYSLYPSGGTSMDYVYAINKVVYSYTIELRPTGNVGYQGFALPPDQIIPQGQEIWSAMESGGLYLMGH